MAVQEELTVLQKQRFRYAAGFMIEQEGPDVVERLVRDGTKTRFGVRQKWVPAKRLEDLTREDAEDLLQDREWTFYNYHKIEDLTIPAKIFDVHITFEFNSAARFAQEVLGIEKTEKLDFATRRAIEEVQSQDFFAEYIPRLETFVNENFDGRKALMRRVQKVPYRNVDSSATFS